MYHKTHKRKEEKLSKTAIARKILVLIAGLFLLSWMALLAGASSYLSAVLVVFLYISWIAAFDTFIIDWLFFSRVRKWRLPGTEHMDKEYAQKWFHLKGVLRVAPLGILYALLCGFVCRYMV